MEDLHTIIGKNLKDLRAKTNYTQGDVANAIGVSQISISEWENGKKIPRSATLRKMANFYGITVEDIINDKPPEERSNQLSDEAIIDFEHLLKSKTRLVYSGRMLSQKEKAITNNLVKAVVMTDDIYKVDENTRPYLVERTLDKLPENVIPIEKGDDLTQIPILGEINAGLPLDAEENFDGYRNVESGFLSEAFDYYWLYIIGDSMEPLIPKHSYVLIECVPDVTDGQIGAVLFVEDTKATLKKIYHERERLVLRSLNDKYEDIYATADNPATILGKAVKIEMDL